MTAKPKFGIETIEIDNSSQESKFNVDDPPRDVINDLQSIGDSNASGGL